MIKEEEKKGEEKEEMLKEEKEELGLKKESFGFFVFSNEVRVNLKMDAAEFIPRVARLGPIMRATTVKGGIT